MTRRLFGVLAILALILAACGGDDPSPTTATGPATDTSTSDAPATTASGELERVEVFEAIHTLLYLPLYVADQAGIFEENGLDVGITSAGAGPAALSSVVAGEAQFSIHGPEHVAFANAEGADVRLVSAMANSVPVWVLGREPYSLPDDLPGLSIQIAGEGLTPHVVFTRWMDDNGISKDDVTLNEAQQGTEAGPVIAGQADIGVTVQPNTEQGLANGLHIVLDMTEVYPDFVFSGVATSTEVLEQRPEMVEAFVRSIGEALDYMRENPEETASIAAAEFPELDEELVTAGVDRMTASNVYPESAVINRAALAASFEFQEFMGNLDTAPSYDEIVSEGFREGE